ncbi:hypothetical protein [Paraburkholderia terrae]
MPVREPRVVPVDARFAACFSAPFLFETSVFAMRFLTMCVEAPLLCARCFQMSRFDPVVVSVHVKQPVALCILRGRVNAQRD